MKTSPNHKYIFTLRSHTSVVPGTIAFSLPQVWLWHSFLCKKDRNIDNDSYHCYILIRIVYSTAFQSWVIHIMVGGRILTPLPSDYVPLFNLSQCCWKWSDGGGGAPVSKMWLSSSLSLQKRHGLGKDPVVGKAM